MAQLTTIIVHLDPEVARVVEEAVGSGQFPTPQDVIVAALSDWQINRLLNAVTSEEPAPIAEAVLDLGNPVDGEAEFGEIDLQSYLDSQTR